MSLWEECEWDATLCNSLPQFWCHLKICSSVAHQWLCILIVHQKDWGRTWIEAWKIIVFNEPLYEIRHCWLGNVVSGITESQNNRMFGAGRDLKRLSGLVPLPEQEHPDQFRQELIQAGFERLRSRMSSAIPEWLSYFWHRCCNLQMLLSKGISAWTTYWGRYSQFLQDLHTEQLQW